MTSPHVVVVNQNAPLETDLRPRREAETLALAGYDVTLVGGCRSASYVRDITAANVGLELYRQPAGGNGVAGQIREQSQAMVRAMLALVRSSRRAPISAVHAGNPPDNLFWAGVAVRSVQAGTPCFVFDQHDAAPVLLAEKFPDTPLARLLAGTARAMERRCFAAARLVIFANDEYRSRALADGLLRSDSEVVPNGWSLPAVPPDPRWRRNREHLLAYVGTIGEQDNVDRLVDAVSLASRIRNIRVVVAGSGSALEAVQRRAQAQGVAPCFDWLGFVRDRRRLAALVEAADICVAPEIHSEFNRLATFVKIMEYMSAGAAVVAHRLPQTEALAGETLEYAPDMTANGLASAIVDLLGAPRRRRALGDAARVRFEERISWDRNGGPRLVAAYDRLFGVTGAP
jgi:alpha-1,6-mannosyltransferase